MGTLHFKKALGLEEDIKDKSYKHLKHKKLIERERDRERQREIERKERETRPISNISWLVLTEY